MIRRMISWISAGLLLASTCCVLPWTALAAKATLNKPANTRLNTVNTVVNTCPKMTLVSSPGPQEGTVGTSLRHQFKTKNPKNAPTYKVIAGQLPWGLKLSTKGLLQGTPQKKGKYSFTIEARQACGKTFTSAIQKYAMVIQAQRINLSIKSHPVAVTMTEAKPATATVTYTFSNGGSGGLKLHSTGGRYMVGKTVIGRITKPLTVSMTRTSGKVTEHLSVPATIINTAKKYNAKKITYIREFKSTQPVVNAQASVTIVLASQPALAIQSFKVYFKEGKSAAPSLRRVQSMAALTTGQTAPSLYAQIQLNRPGAVKGYWKINGKPVTGTVSQKTSGKSLTIAYPHKQTPLSKLPVGKHTIQYVVQSPKTTVATPKAYLTVQAKPTADQKLSVQLKTPAHKSAHEYQGLSLHWSGSAAIALYQIEFSTTTEAKVIFTTTAKQAPLHLKSAQVKSHFDPGKDYRWQVKGLNSKQQVVAESAFRQFQFQTPRTHITGQIVVVTKSSPAGRATLKRLRSKYSLKTIETTSLRTLKRTATVFGTDRDVRTLVRQIGKELGVLQVQPNNLFKTMAEPKNDLQQLYQTLNLSAVHKSYQGKGVRVAIVDTGVDTRHPDLKQRVVQHVNTIRNNPYRAEIHGTALAGVMAASINNYGIAGIAPRAELMALRACWQTSEVDPEGSCTTISIVKAIDLAIEAEAQIINMSFGASTPDGLMMQLIDEGAKNGVLFVAPVGNRKSRKKLPFPASHSKVLAVGGWDQSGRPYPNAELAGAADVCAPASNIFTTIPGKDHNFISGTSISAAIVSGILAVAKEKHRHIGKQSLPAYDGDICRWQEKLINRSVCPK